MNARELATWTMDTVYASMFTSMITARTMREVARLPHELLWRLLDEEATTLHSLYCKDCMLAAKHVKH